MLCMVAVFRINRKELDESFVTYILACIYHDLVMVVVFSIGTLENVASSLIPSS